MNTLARHDVGHGHTCGLHPHPRFTGLRLGGLFFNHPKRIGPAILRDDDARVLHGKFRPTRYMGLFQKAALDLAQDKHGNMSGRLAARTL